MAPALAQVPDQRPGVDAGHPDHALAGERVGQRAARAPVRRGCGTGRAPRSRPPGSAPTRRPRRSSRCCRSAARSAPRSGGGTTGRSGSPGSRSSRWRTRPRRAPARSRRSLAAEDPAVLQDQQRTSCAATFPSRAVIRPRNTVAATVAGSRMPSNGVFAARLASVAPRTVHTPSGSTRVRLAGSPTAIGRPWSASRPICAGRSDSTRATPRQSSSPGSTMVCTSTDSAVCRPSMPGPGRGPLGVLVLRGVRGVVGGHDVDHALGQRGPHGLGVRRRCAAAG